MDFCVSAASGAAQEMLGRSCVSRNTAGSAEPWRQAELSARGFRYRGSRCKTRVLAVQRQAELFARGFRYRGSRRETCVLLVLARHAILVFASGQLDASHAFLRRLRLAAPL